MPIPARTKVVFSATITIALVWFLLSKIEVKEIATTLKDVPPHLVLIGFFFYALSYLFRALRFRVLLQKDIDLGTLFSIVAVHTMWTNLLPFRSGELSYLYLLKKKGGAGSYMTGVPSLILARVFDLVAISVLFMFTFIGLNTFPSQFRALSFALLFFILIILSVAVFLIWKRERFLGRLKYYILKFKLNNISIIEKMLGRGEEILEGFKVVKTRPALYLTAACSLMIWLLIHLYTYTVINAVGVDFNLWQVFFISTLVIFLSLFPIHGWAGFGTTEGIWVLIVIWFGLTKEMAIVTGFQLHAIALCFVMSLGIVGYLSLHHFLRKLSS